ncbi:MAG: hypothetical protein K1X79_08755 [Oligoflexia bacterium]|nr:hypothetical protein [Oligoflexia bacterium]
MMTLQKPEHSRPENSGRNHQKRLSGGVLYGAERYESLYRSYPIARRTIFMHTFPWIVGLALAVLLVVYTDVERGFVRSDILIFGDINVEGLCFLLLIAGVLAAKVIYAVMYRRSIRYFIEGDELVIERGLILKSRESYELRRLAGTRIGLSPRGFIFALHYVEILTLVSRAGGTARLDGFSRSTAQKLQKLLHYRIERASKNWGYDA